MIIIHRLMFWFLANLENFASLVPLYSENYALGAPGSKARMWRWPTRFSSELEDLPSAVYFSLPHLRNGRKRVADKRKRGGRESTTISTGSTSHGTMRFLPHRIENNGGAWSGTVWWLPKRRVVRCRILSSLQGKWQGNGKFRVKSNQYLTNVNLLLFVCLSVFLSVCVSSINSRTTYVTETCKYLKKITKIRVN